MELIAFSGEEGLGYICSGSQTRGIISQLKLVQGSCTLEKLAIEVCEAIT